MEYSACQIVTYLLVLVNAYLTNSLLHLLPLSSLPLAVQETRAVWQTQGAALNALVGGAAKVQMVFSLLLSAALLWSHF
jgi:1,4-dihydroxy-2-naphthoate octaprenyltransferase